MSYNYPQLRQCLRHPEVGNWQRFLNSVGLTDWNRQKLAIDEDFGNKTFYVTRQWQNMQGLPVTGIVRDAERALAIAAGFIPFIPAKGYTKIWPSSRAINAIVIHTMEAPEKPTTAENVAAWFAGPNAPRASAHYCVGQAGIVQCVREEDIAWHAPGLNQNGLGIEHEGYAKQTKEEWADAASKATLMRSAALVASLARKWHIPVKRLTQDQVRRKEPGICGHIDVTNAMHDGKGHWDPGPAFPWDDYLDMVQKAL